MDTPTPEQIAAANRELNPTGDPLGFNAERMLAAERRTLPGNYRPASEAVADIRARLMTPERLTELLTLTILRIEYLRKHDASYRAALDTLDLSHAEHSYVEKYMVTEGLRIKQEEADRKAQAEKAKLDARKLKQQRRKELLLAMSEEDRKLFGYGLDGVKISNVELD